MPSITKTTFVSHDPMEAIAHALQSGDFQEAEALLKAALAQTPNNILLRHNLAELYRNHGNAPQAETMFASIISERADFIPSYRSLILLLEAALTKNLTAEQYRNTTANLSLCQNNMGNAFAMANQWNEAKAAYRRAIFYNERNANAYSNLANLLLQEWLLTEAEWMVKRAIAIRHDFAEAWLTLGSILNEQGRIGEVDACFEQSLIINPNLDTAQKNVATSNLFMQLYRDDLTTNDIVERHRAWGKSYPITDHPELPTIGKKLRIGFISADFRDHAMMQFVLPLLKQLDRKKFEIFCYANQHVEDAITQMIKSLKLTWRPIIHLSDDELRTQLMQDKLHLLIDLNGHSLGNRYDALAHRPVARMAYWLGYMFTTGFPAMDYRITDPWTDPPESAPARHTEHLAYLTQSQFLYTPKSDAPRVTELPAMRNGYITFGSLNNILKLRPAVLDAWASILAAVPNSRLLLKAKQLADPGTIGRIRGHFEARNIDYSRLEFRAKTTDYLQTYHDIDIALDPFPYNGGTTSCDALWMGVPVLTLAGDRSVGRMGASILHALGMDDWITHTTPDYIAQAAHFAADIDALAQLRKNLRPTFKQSPLRDEKGFAADFARCMHAMVTQEIP